MADKNALGMIGLMLGVATMFVTFMGAVAVRTYDGQAKMQGIAPAMATISTAQR